jgi:hypothetical protein
MWQSDWHSLANHNANILFVGNSRTWTSINPFIIDDNLNTNSEIIAVDGQSINFVFLKLKQYLTVNSPPKKIFIQFDSFFLKERDDLYGIDKISPYFFQNKFNVSNLRNKDGFNSVYTYIPILPISFKYLVKLILDIKLPETHSYENTKGYLPQNIKWELKDKSIKFDDNLNSHLYDFKPSSYIDSVIKICKNLNIELIAYNPPSTYPMKNLLKDINAEFLNLSKSYDLYYLDFNDFNEFNDYNLFYNHTHLNEQGSIIFSNLISDRIYNLERN